jgi:hypothetical protein
VSGYLLPAGNINGYYSSELASLPLPQNVVLLLAGTTADDSSYVFFPFVRAQLLFVYPVHDLVGVLSTPTSQKVLPAILGDGTFSNVVSLIRQAIAHSPSNSDCENHVFVLDRCTN